MDPKKEKMLLVLGLGVVIFGLAIFLGGTLRKFTGGNNANVVHKNNSGNSGNISASPAPLPTVEGGNRREITKAVETPGSGDSAPESIAVPTSVTSMGGPLNSSLRQFEIKGEGDKYLPSAIVVDEGDVVGITFSATDRDYDLFFPDFGVYKKIPRGETGKIQFQAYAYGDFKFYCKDSCDGKEIAGRLVVNK